MVLGQLACHLYKIAMNLALVSSCGGKKIKFGPRFKCKKIKILKIIRGKNREILV